MAKGQMRSTKEKNKPKQKKKDKAPSAYAQLYKNKPATTLITPAAPMAPVKKDN
jgi:hypothetical protein